MRVKLFSLLPFIIAGCGGDDGSPVDTVPAELVGTWAAEPACRPQCGFVLISVANPADSINITAFGGTTTEFRISSSGTFRAATLPGPDTISPGQVRVAGSMLIVTDAAGKVDTLDYGLSGVYLDLEWRRRFVSIDFNGDGRADSAIARGRFRRR